MYIIPAILTDDIYEGEQWLAAIKARGKFDRVQIDFIDGEYTTNKSLRVEEWKSISDYPELKFDAHLMVTEKNLNYFQMEAVRLGFDRIMPQIESISCPEQFSGLALNLSSPVNAIERYLPKLGVVLVMGVEAGLGGQRMSDQVMEKIKRLSYLRTLGNLEFKVCVDGGVEQELLSELEKAGADEVAVGVKRVLEWK
jgi:pentose-5-phosphate-3-epimerase